MHLRSDDLPEHLAADIAEMLAEDPRVGELGLRVAVHEHAIEIGGRVATEERRAAIGAVVAEHLPGRTIDNRVEVVGVERPPSTEMLS